MIKFLRVDLAWLYFIEELLTSGQASLNTILDRSEINYQSYSG